MGGATGFVAGFAATAVILSFIGVEGCRKGPGQERGPKTVWVAHEEAALPVSIPLDSETDLQLLSRDSEPISTWRHPFSGAPMFSVIVEPGTASELHCYATSLSGGFRQLGKYVFTPLDSTSKATISAWEFIDRTAGMGSVILTLVYTVDGLATHKYRYPLIR